MRSHCLALGRWSRCVIFCHWKLWLRTQRYRFSTFRSIWRSSSLTTYPASTEYRRAGQAFSRPGPLWANDKCTFVNAIIFTHLPGYQADNLIFDIHVGKLVNSQDDLVQILLLFSSHIIIQHHILAGQVAHQVPTSNYEQTTMNSHPMDYELQRLHQQLFEDVRRYFRYECEPATQRKAKTAMRQTMYKILDRQERDRS